MLLGAGTLLDPDFEPCFPIGWQPPRIAETFELAGYEMAHPQWWYRVRLDTPAAKVLLDTDRPRDGITIRTLDKRRWDDEIELLRRLMNDGFAHEWEHHPATRAQFREFWNPIKATFAHGRRRASGVGVLRRDAPPPRHRHEPHRRTRRDPPRRADNRTGPRSTPRGLGDGEGPRREGDHGPAHHAAPRRGRTPRRPHRHPPPGAHPAPRDPQRLDRCRDHHLLRLPFVGFFAFLVVCS